MAVKVKVGETMRGDIVETHAAGNYAYVGELGHLFVSSQNTTNAQSVVAIYAPGKWETATVERDKD